MADDYKFDTTKPRLAITRTSDGSPVRFDPTDRDFCKFLSWASKQPSDDLPPCLQQLAQGRMYFCVLSDVIDYCKAMGIHLALGGPKVQFHATDIVRIRPDASDTAHDSIFYALTEAVAYSSQMCGADTAGLGGGDGAIFLVSEPVLHQLNAEIEQDETSEVPKLAARTVDRTFVYFDISDFSTELPGHQLAIIKSLIIAANDPSLWRDPNLEAVREKFESAICIGDGYIFVFRDPFTSAIFASYLAALIEQLNADGETKIHFRISVHTGPVYRFWDRGTDPSQGHWNYIGQGINDGMRVLEAIGKDKDDVVYMSAETRQSIMANEGIWANVTEYLLNRGRHKDKHGKMRRLYEINHIGLIKDAEVEIPRKK